MCDSVVTHDLRFCGSSFCFLLLTRSRSCLFQNWICESAKMQIVLMYLFYHHLHCPYSALCCGQERPPVDIRSTVSSRVTECVREVLRLHIFLCYLCHLAQVMYLLGLFLDRTITSQIHWITVLVTLHQTCAHITHIARQTIHHSKNITFPFYSVEILVVIEMSKGLTHAINNA